MVQYIYFIITQEGFEQAAEFTGESDGTSAQA